MNAYYKINSNSQQPYKNFCIADGRFEKKTDAVYQALAVYALIK